MGPFVTDDQHITKKRLGAEAGPSHDEAGHLQLHTCGTRS